jgi:hypothetical protein
MCRWRLLREDRAYNRQCGYGEEKKIEECKPEHVPPLSVLADILTIQEGGFFEVSDRAGIIFVSFHVVGRVKLKKSIATERNVYYDVDQR